MAARGLELLATLSRRGGCGRVVAELLVVLAGGALLAAGWALDRAWLERRFGLERSDVFAGERMTLAIAGLALILIVRPRLGRWGERIGARGMLAACLRIGLATALGVVASEAGLRLLKVPRRYAMGVTSDCLGERNARYGWLFKGAQSFAIETAGRKVHYDFDAEHDRAQSAAEVHDPTQPTIFFVGESIAAGHGLEWEESLPAIVGRGLDLQVVDLGVEGYASDQAFLRLVDALPRFEHPVAIVTLFLPLMVSRIERVDHPRLVFEGEEARLVAPGFLQGLRLTQAFRESFGFRDEWAIETTGEIFRRTARLAKERSARAIFVTPFLGTDWPRKDGYLIDELLVREGLTVVNPRFGFERISRDDGHPNVAATRRLAEAVLDALRMELAAR